MLYHYHNQYDNMDNIQQEEQIVTVNTFKLYYSTDITFH